MADEEAIEAAAAVPGTEEEAEAAKKLEFDNALAGKIMAFVGQSEERNQALKRKAEQINRLYRGQPAEEDVRGGRQEPGKVRARIATLELHRDIESGTSTVDSVVFGDERWYEPWSPELTDQSIDELYLTRRFMDQQHEDMGLRHESLKAIRMGLTYEKVYVETGFRVEKGWEWRQDAVKKEDGSVGGGWVEIVKRMGPMFEVIPPWRVFTDGAPSIREGERVVIEKEWNRKQLEEMIAYASAHGGETRTLEEIDATPASANTGDTTVGQDVGNRIRESRGINTKETGKYLVHCYWGILPDGMDPTDETKRDPRCWFVIVVNGMNWCVKMLNPYYSGDIPLLEWSFIDQPEAPEGIGQGELLMNKQIVINERRSLMQELANQALFGVWRRSGTVGNPNLPKAVRIFPGRVLDDANDGIMARIPTDTTPIKLGMSLEQMDTEEMRVVSGAVANVQAIAQGGTATETRSVASESARRFATVAVSYANAIMRPFLEWQAKLNDQFLPDDQQNPVLVPYGDRMVAVMAQKAQMFFKQLKIRMKVATDVEFRRSMARNINSTIQQVGTVIQVVAQAFMPTNPAVAVQTAQELTPSLVLLSKKLVLIYGERPDEVIPPGVTQRIKAALAVPATPMLPAPAEAGEGGSDVQPVA